MRRAVLAGVAMLLVAAPATAQFDPTAEVIVAVHPSRFDPPVVEARRGIRVSFHNLDPVGRVTIVADDGSFESWELVPGGGHWSHVFREKGTFGFHVKERPEVRGRAQVR